MKLHYNKNNAQLRKRLGARNKAHSGTKLLCTRQTSPYAGPQHQAKKGDILGQPWSLHHAMPKKTEGKVPQHKPPSHTIWKCLAVPRLSTRCPMGPRTLAPLARVDPVAHAAVGWLGLVTGAQQHSCGAVW